MISDDFWHVVDIWLVDQGSIHESSGNTLENCYTLGQLLQFFWDRFESTFHGWFKICYYQYVRYSGYPKPSKTIQHFQKWSNEFVFLWLGSRWDNSEMSMQIINHAGTFYDNDAVYDISHRNFDIKWPTYANLSKRSRPTHIGILSCHTCSNSHGSSRVCARTSDSMIIRRIDSTKLQMRSTKMDRRFFGGEVLTSSSHRVHIKFTSSSLRVHFDFISTPRTYHLHFISITLSMWFRYCFDYIN